MGKILASLKQIAALPPAPLVPVIVIVQDQPEPLPPDWPVEEMTAVFVERAETLAVAIDAKVVVAPNAVSFDAPMSEPAIVVQAMRDVVEAVRNPETWTAP